MRNADTSVKQQSTAATRRVAVRLIVGLGNPGKEYAQTRHNAGADFVLSLARRWNLTLKPDNRFHGLVASKTEGNDKVWLLLPTKMMNNSGQAVGALLTYFRIKASEVLVVHDELDLPVGHVRMKINGGTGGHNGLKDIQRAINDNNFLRLRIGIGHPGVASKVISYVLSKATKSEQDLILGGIDRALDMIDTIIHGDLEPVMSQLHTIKQ